MIVTLIIIILFSVLLILLLYKILISPWSLLLFVLFLSITIYFIFSTSSSPWKGPNTDTKGILISVAVKGTSGYSCKLNYIDDEGFLYVIEFLKWLHFSDNHVKSTNDLSFNINGTTVFLNTPAEFMVDYADPQEVPKVNLKKLQDIINKTEYVSFIGIDKLYLRHINIYHMKDEYLQELSKLMKNIGFEGFSHDYYYSIFEKFSKPMPVGESQFEMTIPFYRKKVRAKNRKAPDGYIKVVRKIEEMIRYGCG